MVAAEIVERVIVNRQAARQPAISRVLAGAAFNLTGTANPLNRGQQPQPQKHTRVNGRIAGVVFHRPDRGQERADINLFNIGPNHPSHMIRRQHLVEGEHLHLHLTTLNPTQTNCRGSIHKYRISASYPYRPGGID